MLEGKIHDGAVCRGYAVIIGMHKKDRRRLSRHADVGRQLLGFFVDQIGGITQDAKIGPAACLIDFIDGVVAAMVKVGTCESRQIADATKNEDSLKQVAIIKDATAAALKLEPAKEKDLPAADQAKFVADYQSKMKDFIATVGKLEDALKANDNVTAAAIVKDMKTQEDSDHSDFRKKKKKS